MINSHVNRCEELSVRSIHLIKLSLFEYNTSEKFINILDFIDLNKINKPPYFYEGLLILDLLFL